MTTKMNKIVKRETEHAKIFSKGNRSIIVSLEPGDLIGFKLKGERKWVHVPVTTVFRYAQMLEAARVKREKAAAKKAKREGRSL